MCRAAIIDSYFFTLGFEKKCQMLYIYIRFLQLTAALRDTMLIKS